MLPHHCSLFQYFYIISFFFPFNNEPKSNSVREYSKGFHYFILHKLRCIIFFIENIIKICDSWRTFMRWFVGGLIIIFYFISITESSSGCTYLRKSVHWWSQSLMPEPSFWVPSSTRVQAPYFFRRGNRLWHEMKEFVVIFIESFTFFEEVENALSHRFWRHHRGSSLGSSKNLLTASRSVCILWDDLLHLIENSILPKVR